MGKHKRIKLTLFWHLSFPRHASPPFYAKNVDFSLFRILAHYGFEKLSDDNVYEPLIGPSAGNMLFSGPKMSE